MTFALKTSTSAAVLLADLARSGVTDIAVEHTFDWSKSLIKKGEKSLSSQHIIHKTGMQKRKAAQKKVQKIVQKKVLLHAKDWVWAVGAGEGLVILTAAEYTTDRARHPMNEKEYILFENMLKAMGMDVTNLSWLCVAAADDKGNVATKNHFEQLSGSVMSKLEDLKPTAVIVLGQVAASMLSGIEMSLLEAREADVLYASSAVGVTYHPRTLLKQPLLKSLAWQDMQRFMKELSA